MAQELPAKAELLGIIQKVNDTWQGRHPGEGNQRTSNAHGDHPYATIAELEILEPDRKPLSRANWKIVYADSEEVSAANNAADKIYDLQESTFWYTAYSGQQLKHPYQIVVDLGEVTGVTGFRYLPRAEADLPGMIKDYRIFVETAPFKY